MKKLILTGDINLVNVADPTAPFRQVAREFREADFVFGNLECCLYDPPAGHSTANEGFYASMQIGGQALVDGGVQAVGIANNVNYGEAAIRSSIARLDALGIAHCGAGVDVAAARAPIVLERDGVRVGFVQRTSVYWPTNHEAQDAATGVAVIRGHTAYEIPMQRLRPDMPPGNRPGVPPLIVTWADAKHLERFARDVAALRERADVVVASCHWGLFDEVLQYMTEIAHAAIDAGADLVIGHGPHYVLPIEIYKGKPILYGLGSFSFHTGHRGKHGDWVGLLARVSLDGPSVAACRVQFVRHDESNQTVLCALAREGAAHEKLAQASAACGTRLLAAADELDVPVR